MKQRQWQLLQKGRYAFWSLRLICVELDPVRGASVPRSSDPGRFRYQSRAALAGEIRPEPLALHAQPVLQPRQGDEVNERPHQPGQETAGAQPAPLQHSVVLADHSHVALVEIAERTFDFSSPQLLRDQPSDVASFLDRRLRDAWHRVFV